MSTPEQLLAHARRQVDQGHLDGALDSVRQVLSAQPEDADAHALLALILVLKRKVYAAEHEAQTALALDPSQSLALFALSQVRMAQSSLNQAEGMLLELIEREPLQPLFHTALGSLHRLRGRPREALACLTKALELDPENVDTLARLAAYHHDRNELQKAEGFVRDALRRQPDHVYALTVMGHILLARGHTQAAHEHAVMALREQPDDEGALTLLTMVKARRSVWTGLWWRYNRFMFGMGEGRGMLVALAAFLAYRVAMIATEAAGHPDAARGLHYAWLAVVAYTFVGPLLFERALRKELASIRLKGQF